MTVNTYFPKVSIIMPTYNRAAFIMETIDSICSQHYQHWELLIIDDGSTDNTMELVAGLHEPRIHYYRLEKTGIGGKIKNAGLHKATGDLYAFIDSDDLWHPRKLEAQVAALTHHPQADCCLTGGYNFIVPGVPVEYFYKQKEGMKTGNVFTDYFRSELPGFTQALLFRKECLEKTGMFKEVKAFSDVEFILSLAYHYSFVILYEPLFYRRLHSSNYINSSWEKSYEEGVAIIASCKQNKMIDAGTAKASLFNLYINFGEDCLKHRKNLKAINHFIHAWTNNPFSFVPFRKTGKALWRSMQLI